MKYLLDTHLLLVGLVEKTAMPRNAAKLIDMPGNEFFFSAASLWEVAIKCGRGRAAFTVDPEQLRRKLMRTGLTEVHITSEQAIYVCRLPPIHKDPFDRLLIAQATVEGITLLTSDAVVLQYPGPIQCV